MDSSSRSTAAIAPKPSKRTRSASVAWATVRQAATIRVGDLMRRERDEECESGRGAIGFGKAHQPLVKPVGRARRVCAVPTGDSIAQKFATRFAQQRTTGARRAPKCGERDPDRCISGPGGHRPQRDIPQQGEAVASSELAMNGTGIGHRPDPAYRMGSLQVARQQLIVGEG